MEEMKPENERIKKTVKPSGNGAVAYCPKDWIGDEVLIIRLNGGEKEMRELGDIKIEYDWQYSLEQTDPEFGLCRAKLKNGEMEIERTYDVLEDGTVSVETKYLYKNRNVHEERTEFEFEEVFSGKPKNWIKKNNEADPEEEFRRLKQKL